jgi:hypothetical protein
MTLDMEDLAAIRSIFQEELRKLIGTEEKEPDGLLPFNQDDFNVLLHAANSSKNRKDKKAVEDYMAKHHHP